MAPRVSVLVPAYNAGPHLKEALGSLQCQSFKDFEVLVVDDGSTDETGAIGTSFSNDDRRFRVIHQDNGGIAHALNTAISHSSGEYLLRMDADDLSAPSRIDRQVRYLDAHPSVAVLGSAVRQFTSDVEWTLRYPDSNGPARAMLLFRPPFCHPAVIMRAAALKEHGIRYDPQFSPCEDFKLWSDLSPFAEFGNLREPLLMYRVHQGQATYQRRERQESLARQVCADQLGRIQVSASDAELKLHRSIAFGTPFSDRGHLNRALDWIDTVTDANRRVGWAPPKDLARYLAHCWTVALGGTTSVYRRETYLSAPRFWRDLPAPERILRHSKAALRLRMPP